MQREETTMTERARDVQEKNVTLPNGLKIHYHEWPGPRPNLVLLHPSSGYGACGRRRRTPSGHGSTCTPSTSGATATVDGRRQMENPAGPAQALASFAAQAAKD
jgi:hypothetical protein